jgi:putative (di)nucleoside polyphosphate hydrolase
VPKRYRSNVAAIVENLNGDLLIGRRHDYPESWQFPQGGVDGGESLREAMHRELQEEAGLKPDTYELIHQTETYRYDFPAGPDARGFSGQEQVYFLLRGNSPQAQSLPDPAQTCGEFTAFRWAPVHGFPVHLAPPMKQDVYRLVLQELAPYFLATNHLR